MRLHIIIAGIVWSLCPFLPLLPFTYYYFFIVSLACALAVRRCAHALLAATFFAAWGVGLGQLEIINSYQLPNSQDGTQWRGEIKIVQLRPSSNINSSQIIAEIVSSAPDKKIPAKGTLINLTWPKTNSLIKGQHWLLSIKMQRLHGLLNPDSLDFTALNLLQGIYLYGQVQTQLKTELLPRQINYFDQLQSHLYNQLVNNTKLEYTRFYLALAFGDTSGLSQADWQILQHTGTVHLMAISGFQIGLMASVGFWLGLLLAKPLCLLLGNHPTIMHWPHRLMPALMSVIWASFYTHLANFSLPAERAWVACLLVNLAWIMQLRTSLFQLWLLCWIISLVCHPLAPLNKGFWLSYLAVGALLYLVNKKQRSKYWQPIVQAQWVITIALIMPQLILAIPFSTNGLLANLILAPWIGFIITPLVFLFLGVGLLIDTSYAFIILDDMYFILWCSLEKLSQIPISLWWPSFNLGLVDIVLACSGTLLVLLPRCLGFYYLGYILLGLGLLAPRLQANSTFIEVLDVGQGLAVLIKTPDHTILFDTGPKVSARFDAGTHIISPHLLSLGVHKLEVWISRDNAEHAGGLNGLKQFQWTQLITAEPLAEYPNYQFCQAGASGHWDYVHWQVLAPPVGFEDYSRSCALKLVIGSRNIYLFGDISTAQQQVLLQEQTNSAYLLVAPGQGAKNQHLAAMAQHLKPKFVVFSNGHRNRYNHPHPDALAAYRQVNSQILITARDGAMRWEWPAPQAEPKFSSQWPARQRYWYQNHSAGNLNKNSASD